ncbi:LINE-1 type transposase domain-containing protein 1 [Labeo rohita]|uniref:LINE-1 type transposase domain-containing protein 1 n=1 Tax=Labeo rohita TaxID=84645 RepID=A0ABQ8L0V8_LABRO|nr:LINE-1 type transposase domain-containing protein 1 [Labeo rohita]
MAAKSAKQGKKDQKAVACGDDGKEVSMAAIANLLEEHRAALSADFKITVSTLETVDQIQTTVVDLESRSRRNNIRIIGLPESTEGPRPSVFFSELLAEVFGDGVLESPPECDRAHRSLSDKPKPGQRPRPVIVRLHRFQQKEKIIREIIMAGWTVYVAMASRSP